MTLACALPAVAAPIVGAPGTPPVGVTLLDAADAGPMPLALVAFTLKVYAVPLARPMTLIVVQGAVQVPVTLPGNEVAM